jgi:hypothetical protein
VYIANYTFFYLIKIKIKINAQPFDTRTLSSSSKAACRVAYEHIREQVQDGLYLLKDYREQDPYRDLPNRLAYETQKGNDGHKQAPSAPLSVLEELVEKRRQDAAAAAEAAAATVDKNSTDSINV